MSGHALAALLACVALAHAGCGGETAGARDYTCAQVRDSITMLRDQARVLVDRAGPDAHRLFNEEAVLDAEFQIGRACEGAADGYRPYTRAVGLSSPGWFSPTAR